MKSIVQLLGAVLAAVTPLLVADEPPTLVSWINVGVVAAGAVTVYIAANDETGGIWSMTKMLMSLVSATGVVLIASLSDGHMSAGDWMQAGSALLAALAVYEFPKDFTFVAAEPPSGNGDHDGDHRGRHERT